MNTETKSALSAPVVLLSPLRTAIKLSAVTSLPLYDGWHPRFTSYPATPLGVGLLSDERSETQLHRVSSLTGAEREVRSLLLKTQHLDTNLLSGEQGAIGGHSAIAPLTVRPKNKIMQKTVHVVAKSQEYVPSYRLATSSFFCEKRYT